MATRVYTEVQALLHVIDHQCMVTFLSSSHNQIIWTSAWYWKAWIMAKEWIYFLESSSFCALSTKLKCSVKCAQECTRLCLFVCVVLLLEFESSPPLPLEAIGRNGLENWKIWEKLKVCEKQSICWESHSPVVRDKNTAIVCCIVDLENPGEIL